MTIKAGAAAGWPAQPVFPRYGRPDGGSPLNLRPSGSVSITGVATEDEVLTAVSTLTDPETLGTLHYQWVNSVSGNVGTDASTYTLVTADVGDTVYCVVTYTDGSAQAESYTTASTTAIAGLPGGHFMANGDMNWLNPDLTALSTQVPVTQTGGTYSLSFKEIDLATLHAISLTNVTTVDINNCLITDPGGTGIELINCGNISLRNNKITGTNTTDSNEDGQGVQLYQCNDNILIESCWFDDNATAILLYACSDASNVKIRGNYCFNPSRGTTATHGGNFVEAIYSERIDLQITFNVMNADFTSEVQDWINLYRSYGTAAYPILVDDNMIDGSGTSSSGGGILVGDAGSEAGTPSIGYIYARRNELLNPGQYGMSISAGIYGQIVDNKIVSALTNTNIINVNVGVPIWRQGTGAPPGSMYGATVGGNRVKWWSRWGGVSAFENPQWLPTTGDDSQSPNHGTVASGNVNPTDWGTNTWSDATVESELSIPSTWAYYAPTP